MKNKVVWLLLGATVLAAAAMWWRRGTPTSDIIYFAWTVPLAVAVCVTAARQPARRNRAPWCLIALALVLWLSGDGVQTLQYYAGYVPPFGLSDVLWLAGYPAMAAALLMMARYRAAGRVRGVVLDGLTLTFAAGIAAYVYFCLPIIDEGFSTLESVTPALYPLGDVMLLAGVLMLFLSPGRRGGPTYLMLVAATLYLLTDSANNVLMYVVHSDVSWDLDGAVLLGNCLLAAAGLHPRRGELTEPGRAVEVLHPARVLFLGAALATAPTVVLTHTGLGPGGRTILMAATLACIACVLIRFLQAVRGLERTQAQLAYQARHDPLTGLANRAAFTEHLDEDTAGVLLYLDLDGFKAINDRDGHEAGDAVLKAVGQRLTAAVRSSDLVARLGGDEFVIACTAADVTYGQDLAQRIVTEVSRPVEFGGRQLAVGVSIGIAAHVTTSPDARRAALLAADEAMYAAKHRGKGNWVVAA
ncbi:Cellulose synthesis regulatory protein [Actinoplanes sp. SE50]|uniref:GGDEF domain-containing protein n=1 Tax=unclassified Actinoplanes TaxID=2626549 RepID=UPI00023EC4F5|nr:MULTISPECIES: GGDEF domain-containing protein [unclassified Actinoplanes]AEV87018.1 Cellulose synthesis regulatory protein [Actinoplanes sp. SE50/110]ATO85416.1 Cellulose synthesis regulatory protein [Actinoplanes sp. SE50]SLM02828.1 Cellulose synthesis regulatory protein [Actinoplanes sp. SE50/110]